MNPYYLEVFSGEQNRKSYVKVSGENGNLRLLEVTFSWDVYCAGIYINQQRLDLSSEYSASFLHMMGSSVQISVDEFAKVFTEALDDDCCAIDMNGSCYSLRLLDEKREAIRDEFQPAAYSFGTL